MSDEEDLQGTLMTANDVANLLHANYRTVRKILEDKRILGELKEDTLIRANRSTIAYYMNNSTIKSINSILKDIKNPKKSIAHANKNTNDTKNSNINTQAPTNAPTNAGYYDSTNVKFYEVMKENSFLQNELKELKNTYDKEHEKAIQLQAELYKAQSDIKLIEVKQNSFEAENSKLTQQNIVLEKAVSQKDKIIIALACVIGAIVLVSITIAVMLQVIK